MSASSTAALVAGIALILVGAIVLANPKGERDRAARVNARRAPIGRPTTPRGIATLSAVSVALGVALVVSALAR